MARMRPVSGLAVLSLSLLGGLRPAPAEPVTLAPRALRFEENCGQSDERVRFLARARGYAVFLTADEVVLAFAPSRERSREGAVVRLRLVGADPGATVAGLEPLAERVSYFRGSDPRHHVEGAPTYERVRYQGVYPGIDFVPRGQGGALEYDFFLAPGAEPGDIALELDGASGLELDGCGGLRAHIPGLAGDLRQPRPRAWQDVSGARRDVDVRYELRGDRVGFAVGAHDPRYPLVIDPLLSYSTYLGGGDDDYGLAVAADAAGGAYITGYSWSADFPLAGGATRPLAGESDAFIARLTPAGDALVWSTYLGGNGEDSSVNIALDAAGDAYIVGSTDSDDLPVVNPAQPLYADFMDVFVAKLAAADGRLLYSTYLGGSGSDFPGGIAVDGSGRAVVAGETESADFPRVGPQLSTGTGVAAAFVTRLSATGDRLEVSLLLGDGGLSGAIGVGLDAAGKAYVAGRSYGGFPRIGPLGPTYHGDSDAFVAKLDLDAPAILYSGILGGRNVDNLWTIAVRATGEAFVAGNTTSPDFPTANPYQSQLAGPEDVFVTKVAADGSALVYSTYLGGGGYEVFGAIAVDSSGAAYVACLTGSSDYPTAAAFQWANAGSYDAALSKLAPDGRSLVYSTYLGGSGDEDALGVAVDATGAAYVIGETGSSDFPLVRPLQGALAALTDAFLARFAPCDGGTTPGAIALLRLTRSPSDLDFTWAADPLAQSYDVYETLARKDVPPDALVGSAASPATGLTIPFPSPSLIFYQVVAMGPCGPGPR